MHYGLLQKLIIFLKNPNTFEEMEKYVLITKINGNRKHDLGKIMKELRMNLRDLLVKINVVNTIVPSSPCLKQTGIEDETKYHPIWTVQVECKDDLTCNLTIPQDWVHCDDFSDKECDTKMNKLFPIRTCDVSSLGLVINCFCLTKAHDPFLSKEGHATFDKEVKNSIPIFYFSGPVGFFKHEHALVSFIVEKFEDNDQFTKQYNQYTNNNGQIITIALSLKQKNEKLLLLLPTKLISKNFLERKKAENFEPTGLFGY
ncbi:hypothetical protein RFI_04837, partial [Reticulomyxa filosa]